MIIGLFLLQLYYNVTDRQTDGLTHNSVKIGQSRNETKVDREKT